jgi:hypothetical protein
MVHDERGSQLGQIVRFNSVKPISKMKKWKVIEVVDSISPSLSKKRKIVNEERPAIIMKENIKIKKKGIKT